MYSLDFPNIFSRTKTNLVQDKQAALSNLKLVLGSCKHELLGDPFFGTALKQYFFMPNDVWVEDLVIDTIYETIRRYVPQIVASRKNISIEKDETTLYITLKFQYIIDKTLDTVNIELIEQ